MKEQLKLVGDSLKYKSKVNREVYKIGIDLIEYNDTFYNIIDRLLSIILTIEGVEDFKYYVYEYQKGDKFTYIFNGVEKHINTFDDFFEYLENNNYIRK